MVKYATDNKSFYDTMERNREHDGEEEKEEKDLPPVFNKRLFVTQGAVIITKEARRIMAQNARCSPDQDPSLTKSEMLTLRSVVEGLKLIHKGQDYIKNVLSRCVTLENYNAFQYVKKKPWEDTLSCYYVVHGAVEVTYDMSGAGQSSSRNVYQPNIIYSHGTAEYLGIVSAEGRDEDIAPPATVYTKEQCEFIRIDRDRFHRLIEVEETILKNEIQRYFKSGSSILSILADDVQAKILQMIQKHVRFQFIIRVSSFRTRQCHIDFVKTLKSLTRLMLLESNFFQYDICFRPFSVNANNLRACLFSFERIPF